MLASLEAAGTFSVEDVEVLGRRFHSLEELRGTYERCPKGEIFGFSSFFGGGLGMIFEFQTTGIIMRRLGRIGQCRSILRLSDFSSILPWVGNTMTPARGV